MRLYTRTGATALDHPDYGHFDADPAGGFDFPNELSDQVHGFAIGGRPLWETDVERQQRLVGEELARRRDPASLYEAVAQLMSAAQSATATSVTKQEAPALNADEGSGSEEDDASAEKQVRAPRKAAASRRATKAE